MQGILFFRLFPGDAPPMVVDPHGTMRPATPLETTQHNVICAVPGLQVLLTRLHMPTRNRRQTEKALPFMLEDNLIGNLEDQHFAMGPRLRNQPLGVAITTRRTMQNWLERLRSKGLRPSVLVSEPLLLPWEEGTWCIAVEPHQVLVRTSLHEGFATDRTNLPTFLSLALRQAKEAPPQRVRVLDGVGDFDDPLPLPGLPVQVERLTPNSLTPILAQGYHKEGVINLLQGPFSPQSTLFSRKMLPYRTPLMLLAAWLVLESGLEISQHFTLSQRLEQGETQIIDLFRATFPDIRRIVDAEAQMKQELKSLQGKAQEIGISFLDLITAAGEVMSRHPNAQILRLGFQDGELDLHFLVDNLEQLNQIKADLQAKPGLRTEIRSAAADQGKVQCHIQISWTRDEK